MNGALSQKLELEDFSSLDPCFVFCLTDQKNRCFQTMVAGVWISTSKCRSQHTFAAFAIAVLSCDERMLMDCVRGIEIESQ